LISDEDDRESTSCPAEFFLQFGKGFIIGRVSNVERFDFEGGNHRLQCWKITLKNGLTGLAILSVEEIDLDGRGGLCGSTSGRREENKNTDGNQKGFHDFVPPLIIY
jgi:hypothetical protein